MDTESETPSSRRGEQRISAVENLYTFENTLTAISLLMNAAEHRSEQF